MSTTTLDRATLPDAVEPLKDVFARINDCRLSQLEGLLPMYWKPA